LPWWLRVKKVLVKRGKLTLFGTVSLVSLNLALVLAIVTINLIPITMKYTALASPITMITAKTGVAAINNFHENNE
jgi:hypothetical protein